jgi:hypothetical protein
MVNQQNNKILNIETNENQYFQNSNKKRKLSTLRIIISDFSTKIIKYKTLIINDYQFNEISMIDILLNLST